jgi:hypothetical protein
MEVLMSTPRRLIAPVIFVLLASTTGFAGPQHLVGPSQLAAAIDERVAAGAADRAAIREALARPEVRESAAKLGLDLARATAAIDTMEGPDLGRAADAARRVNEQFVGGDSITITTTTLIVILLLLILLVVAVK